MEALFWLAVAALVVLSPLSWLKPSRRDKQIIALREAARRKAIQVSVLPLSLADGKKIPGVAYRWLRQPDAPALQGYFCWARTTDMQFAGYGYECFAGWRLVQGRMEQLTNRQLSCIEQWLQALPEDCFALEWGSASLAIWWHERGDESLLDDWQQRAVQLFATL